LNEENSFHTDSNLPYINLLIRGRSGRAVRSQTAGRQACGATFSQTAGATFSQTAGATFSQTAGATFSQTAGATFSQTAGATFSQTAGATFSQTAGETLSQTAGATFSQTAGATRSQAFTATHGSTGWHGSQERTARLPKRKLNKLSLATACEPEKTTSETSNAGNIIL